MKNYNAKFYYIKNIKDDWEVLEWFFIKIFIKIKLILQGY